MTGEVQPAAPAPPPVPSGEDAQWAALAKEMEDGGEGEPKGESIPEPAPKEGEPTPEAKPKPTYEELEGNYRNIQAALREQRERLQREGEARRQSDERLTGITQLIERLRSGREQPQEIKTPTVDEDPIGYFQAELAKRDQVIQQLQQGTQKNVEQVQAQQQEQAFWGAVERSEIEIRKTATDYDAACQHLEAGRVAELQVMLPDDSPQAQAYAAQFKATPAQLRAHLLNQDRIAVAQQALQLGMSPAQLYYSLAKQRGFKAAAGAKNGAANGADKVIETMRRGQSAAKTISGGGGKSDGVTSIAGLTELYADDPEAFDKAWDKAAHEGLLG